MKKSQVKFDKQKLFNEIWEQLAKEQTASLIEYAKKKILEIGDRINSYESKNHMDDTGNLLDSLCWGVSYEGSLVEGGFYRPQQAHLPSYLHEWSTASWYDQGYGEVTASAAEEVHGHELAEAYIQKYGNNGGKGWKVFFAVLAPYWGYWELKEGFKMKHIGGGTSFERFAVMTEFFDTIRKDLKPARTRFRVSVAKYASKSLYSRAKKEFYGK